MSSHYIIRDDQAPTLVIYHAGAVEEHIILSLLEWHPRVIVEESSLGFVLHNRVNVDAVILNQMSEDEVEELIGYQKPFDIFFANSVPNELIEYMRSKKTHAVDLIGEFDTAVIKLAYEMEPHFPVFIYSEHTKHVHLNSGVFRKWSSPGKGYTVFPPDSNLKTINLKTLGHGNYKVLSEGIIEFSSTQPIWVGEIIA